MDGRFRVPSLATQDFPIPCTMALCQYHLLPGTISELFTPCPSALWDRNRRAEPAQHLCLPERHSLACRKSFSISPMAQQRLILMRSSFSLGVRLISIVGTCRARPDRAAAQRYLSLRVATTSEG